MDIIIIIIIIQWVFIDVLIIIIIIITIIRSDTGNNRGDWNHLKITQAIPQQRTGKARN